MTDNERYSLPASPFKSQIERSIGLIQRNAAKLNRDDRHSVESVLYYTIEKRMLERAFENDEKTYLSGLLQDITSAKSEFDQVCYQNEHAREAFSQLKYSILSLIS